MVTPLIIPRSHPIFRKDKRMQNNIYKILEELIKIQSDTNTHLEKDIEKYLLDHISQMPWFKDHPTFGLEALSHDDLERGIVWALLKGNGPNTIILLNHHDAVDIDVYRNLKEVAFDSEALRTSLKNLKLDDDTHRDLDDSNWMFGRGTADMKAGIAIHLHILEKYAKENLKGNLLFISVPDEENLSQGMRHGSQLLSRLSDTYDLKYELLINSEPHERTNNKFTIYDSSVGKNMAAIYVQGIKSHIGKIYDGLNPTLLLSNIVQKTELNPMFSDSVLGDQSPPPSWSYVRDFKASYDASVPEAAGGYLSFLTLESTPIDILSHLKEICSDAMTEMVEHKKRTYETIYKRTYDKVHHLPQVKLYQDLLQDATHKNKQATEQSLRESKIFIKDELKAKRLTIPESNFILIRSLLDIVTYNEPTAVVALSPPFYPHISTETAHQSVMGTVKDILKEDEIDFQHYFMGISDLSYTGLQNADKITPYVAPNMPLWDEDFYTIDFSSLKKLSIPSIILGPWGKDLHKMTERVYVPDLVENTHLLISKLIDQLL